MQFCLFGGVGSVFGCAGGLMTDILGIFGFDDQDVCLSFFPAMIINSNAMVVMGCHGISWSIVKICQDEWLFLACRL